MPVVQKIQRKRDIATLAQKHGLRLTKQRRLIISILESASTHLNAKEILKQARTVEPKIDQVTIYRTLTVLKQLGVVDELDLLHIRGDQHYYEAKQLRAHSHVACLVCGKVFEFFSPTLDRINHEIEKELGFSVSFTRMEIGGYCAQCRKEAAPDEACNLPGYKKD